MYKYIEILIKCLGSTLGTFLHKAVDAISCAFKLLDHYLSYKEDKNVRKTQDAKETKIDDVCDNGTIDDLFNLKKAVKLLALSSLCILSGCTATKIQLQTTKVWEGHYFTESSFHEATKDVELEKGESIWVLSNQSLKRVLLEQQSQ